MKLVILTRYFFPWGGNKVVKKGYGADWRIYELYKKIAENHDVKIITQKILSIRKNRDKLDGMDVIYSPCLAPFFFLTRLFLLPRFLTALKESRGADAIIAEFHPFHCIGFEAWLVSKILGKPLILDVHDVAPNAIYIQYERLMCSAADLIVATSPEMREYMKKYNKNIVVIENGVNIREVSAYVCNKKPKEPIVGFLGSLTPQHGVGYLIEAFRHVLQKVDGRLVIIGDGRERKNLEKLAKEHGIADNIEFTGFLPREKVYETLACADVLVAPFPSGREFKTNLPLKILEYLALGNPVVVTRIPVLQRIAEESEACLVAEPMNSIDISDKILEILKMKKEDRENMGKKGMNYVKEYDWGNLAKKFETELMQVLK